jgi:Universal stress protein family
VTGPRAPTALCRGLRKFARSCGAELLVAHATGLLAHIREGHPVPCQSHLVELKWTLEKEWCAPLESSDVRYRTCLPQGPPALALGTLAHNEAADMIVVGRNGRGAKPGLSIGSTSSELVEHSRTPVVVVPAAPGSSGKWVPQ